MESNRNYLDTEGIHAPRGLRERKRLETLCAIEDHATRLVLDKGYDNVTIEDIVDAANISKRTFFNYVDSKETAVLGHPVVDLPEKERKEFLAADPQHVTVALVDLILQTSFASRGRSDEFSTLLLSRRKQIFRKNPNIAAPQFGLTIQRFHNIVELVDEFFTLHPERRSLPQTAFPGTESTSGVSEEAVTLAMLCQDAVRIGTLRWTRQPDGTNGHRRLRDCCLGAFTLFYDVLGAPPRNVWPARHRRRRRKEKAVTTSIWTSLTTTQLTSTNKPTANRTSTRKIKTTTTTNVTMRNERMMHSE